MSKNLLALDGIEDKAPLSDALSPVLTPIGTTFFAARDGCYALLMKSVVHLHLLITSVVHLHLHCSYKVLCTCTCRPRPWLCLCEKDGASEGSG